MIRASALRGFKLGARDGDIGRVKDIYFDDQKWAMRYLVADTGRSLPRRTVLISPHVLGEIRESEQVIEVDLFKDRIKGSPSIDQDAPVSREYERRYFGYYGLPEYWGGPLVWGHMPYPAAYPGIYAVPGDWEAAHDGGGEENHLRSFNEVKRYRIHARDGEVGRAEDLLLDPDHWSVRYLVLSPVQQVPVSRVALSPGRITGKKVLVSPEWITDISWDKRHVMLDLGRESIKTAPDFDPQQHSISREYEEQLHRHYEKDPYWRRPTEAVPSR